MTRAAPPADLRERIVEAGERVFAERGYAGATVEDFIAEAQTSRATFYRYFRNKDDLFRELSLSCFREMRAVVRGFSELGPGPVRHEELEQLVALYLQLHKRHGGVIRAWTERTAAPDSPEREQAALTFGALLAEMSRAVGGTESPYEVESNVRATLLFLAIERSSFYVTNRHSRVEPSRLPPTLATMIERAYFGGSPASAHQS